MSSDFTSEKIKICPVCDSSHNRSMMMDRRVGKEVTVNAGRGHLISCCVLMCSKCNSVAKNISIGVIFEDLTTFVRHMETKLPYQIKIPGGMIGCWDKPTVGSVVHTCRVGKRHIPVNRIEHRPIKKLKITAVCQDVMTRIYQVEVLEVVS